MPIVRLSLVSEDQSRGGTEIQTLPQSIIDSVDAWQLCLLLKIQNRLFQGFAINTTGAFGDELSCW